MSKRHTSLADLQHHAQQLAEEIRQAQSLVGHKAKELERVVKQYEEKRWTRVREILRQNRLTFCTHCRDVMRVDDAKYLVTEDLYTHLRVYYHRACPTCVEVNLKQSGDKAMYEARDRHCFHAFVLEIRRDGIYAHKFGEWERLPVSPEKLPKFLHSAFDQMATVSLVSHEATRELNFPPHMTVSAFLKTHKT